MAEDVRNTAEYHLTLAKCFIEEVKEKLKKAENLSEDEIRESYYHLDQDFERDISLAVQHCELAFQINPNAFIEDEPDIKYNPKTLQAEAYFVLGRAKLFLGNEKEAITCFEESLKYEPNQTTLYNIAVSWEAKRAGKIKKSIWGTLASIAISRLLVPKEKVIAAYEKAMLMNPLSPIGLKAAMQIERLKQEVETPTDIEMGTHVPPGIQVEETVTCATCGTPVSSDDKVCPNCGEKFEENSKEER